MSEYTWITRVILLFNFIIPHFFFTKAFSTWPEGTYSLPRPITGCPPNWKEGMRYQDTENVLNSNQKSSLYHLSGSIDKHGIRQEFCTKLDPQTGKGDWPSGQYCIYRYGAYCPDGLKEGKSDFAESIPYFHFYIIYCIIITVY